MTDVAALVGELRFGPGDPPRYAGRHEVVDAVLVRGGERIDVVVKKTRLDLGQRLRGSRAERSFRVATALVTRGLPTPEPFGVRRLDGESWYVARRVLGAAQIRAWFRRRYEPSLPPPPVEATFEDVVRAVGSLARRMHDGGVFFRDFTDGNVLVAPTLEGFSLWLVDLDRARLQSRPLAAWPRLRDLSRLGLNAAEDRRLLLASYFGGEPPGWAVSGVTLLRGRIRAWDAFKRSARPWRRRRNA